jgi:hypothetical protein
MRACHEFVAVMKFSDIDEIASVATWMDSRIEDILFERGIER